LLKSSDLPWVEIVKSHVTELIIERTERGKASSIY
jgi:hypothetical protein